MHRSCRSTKKTKNFRDSRTLTANNLSIVCCKVPPGQGRVTKLSAPPVISVEEEEEDTPAQCKGYSFNDQDPSHNYELDLAGMSRKQLAQERRSLLMKLFADTGTAKIPAVIR